MKMKILSMVSAAVVVAAFGILAVGAGEGDKKEKSEVKVALADLPAAVKQAAEKAVPGIVLTEAEKETKGTEVVYELDGKVGDKEYELKVTAEGKVLKAKVEDADDDDAGEKAGKDGKKGGGQKGKDEADGDNHNDHDGDNEADEADGDNNDDDGENE